MKIYKVFTQFEDEEFGTFGRYWIVVAKSIVEATNMAEAKWGGTVTECEFLGIADMVAIS